MEDLNPGPDACMASAFITELPPGPFCFVLETMSYCIVPAALNCDSPAFTSQVLGLQACTTVPG